MPPLVRAGLCAALVATAALATDHPASVTGSTAAPAAPASSGDSLSALCPPGTLPDHRVCVPIPLAPAEAAESRGAARDDSLERIERRPDRPRDFSRYRLPLAPVEPPADEGSRGVLLAAAEGTRAVVVALEHQEGDVFVLHAGTSDAGAPSGTSVVTVHSVREASGLREYLAIHSGLRELAPGVTRGAKLAAGTPLGVVGAARGGLPALRYELRRARAGVNAKTLVLGDLTGDAKAVASDPRNVLPLLP